MSRVSAQISLYPLRRTSIGPTIRRAVRNLRERGLYVRVGEMSTLVWGEEGMLFDALREAFHQAAEQGDVVMSVTLSNACPEPAPPAGRSLDSSGQARLHTVEKKGSDASRDT